MQIFLTVIKLFQTNLSEISSSVCQMVWIQSRISFLGSKLFDRRLKSSATFGDSALKQVKYNDASFEYLLTFLKLFEPQHMISNIVAFLKCIYSDEPVQPPFKLRNSK